MSFLGGLSLHCNLKSVIAKIALYYIKRRVEFMVIQKIKHNSKKFFQIAC